MVIFMKNKKKPYTGYKKPVPENVKVIRVERTQDFYTEYRYIIINSDTGEVFDDAQGYGYKTAQKAYAAFAWKKKSPDELIAINALKQTVQDWCSSHSDIVRDIQDTAFESIKNNERYSIEEIEQLIPDDVRAEMPFTVKELLKYM